MNYDYFVVLILEKGKENTVAQRERFTASNVIQKNRFFGLKKRNLAEGVVWAGIIAMIVNSIPFVDLVKGVVIAVLGVAIIILNGFGIKGYAFSATVINFIDYRYYTRKFSYRRLSRDTKQTRPIVDDNMEVRTIKENRTVQTVKKIFGR